MSKLDVMVDLETMGIGSDAAIVAIGAVGMDMDRNEVDSGTPPFYTTVDLASSVEAGGVMDVSTVLWWLQQSEAARKEVYERSVARPLHEALFAFSHWYTTIKGYNVWGNGAGFDNIVLRTAYIKSKIPAPWKHTQDRCYRTINAEYGKFVTVPEEGTKHHALDDAIYQARRLLEINKRIRIV